MRGALSRAVALSAGCAAVFSSVVAGGGLASSIPSGAANVPLVVYSAQGYDSAMTKAFTKATGIPVQLDDNSTGPLLTQIEASKNNPQWGLLWVDGPTAFAGLDQQGLLMRHWEPSVSWNSLGTASVPKNGSYIPMGMTLTAAVVYNSNVVRQPPTTWNQLLTSQWKGTVGMNDPSQSGPTYPFIAGMMNFLGGNNGVAAGEAYFTKLKANGLVVNPTNGPTLQALTSGQIKIALVQSSSGIGAALGDSALKVKYLPPITNLPSVIGIDAKASSQVKSEAEKFVNYVLSKAGQKVMQSGDPTGDSLYYPVINSVKPLPALPSLSNVKTQTINPYLWGPREPSINQWFDANIAQ